MSRSLDVAGKSRKVKKHIEQTVERDLNDLHSVKVDVKVAKDEETLKDAEDEVEDGVAKIFEKKGEKMEIVNETKKEPEKVNVDMSMMNSKADENAPDPNLNDQVAKMLVDESAVASGIDPIKFSNIRQRVERARRSNKDNLANAPRRTSRKLREKASSLVDSTTEDDNIVDVDRIVEQVIKQVNYDPWRKYKGLIDFCGHDSATEEQRNTISVYLSRDKLDCTMWFDSFLEAEGPLLCNVLFGKSIWSECEVLRVLGEH